MHLILKARLTQEHVGGPHKGRLSFCIAELYMANKNTEAACQAMERAIVAKRIALGPSHPAVAVSVVGLAAIHRASGSSSDAVNLLQKELNFLTEEGQASSPGNLLAP